MVIKSQNELSKADAGQHKRFNKFAAGSQVMMHLQKEWFLKLTSQTYVQKAWSFRGCKESSNAYIVDTPDGLQISLRFVAVLFYFHGFDEVGNNLQLLSG